jgi:hypothetical protein
VRRRMMKMKNKRILAGAFGWFRAACLPQPAFLGFDRLGRISTFGKNNK